MDITKVLNALIAVLIPTLNQALPKYIVDEDLDPWADVVSGTDTLGKIDLGVCTASVKASYTIEDMVGLSSIAITGMTVDTFDGANLPTVTGTISMAAKLNKDLSAKIKGKLTAACGILSESASISGKATATGVTGSGKGTFTATLDLAQSCFTEVKLDSLKLNYSHIKIEISGLGIFNEFLDPLIDVINSVFGSAIKSEVASALKPVLNDLIKDELPLCISTDAS